MGAAKRSAFSLRSFARSHVAFNCVLVEVMERKANVAFVTSSLKLDLSMVAWLSSMNGLQELCVYVFQIRVITVTPDDISWILQYPIFPSLTRDQSFTRVARNETKYEKTNDAADFDSREDCSFIRLNDAVPWSSTGRRKKTWHMTQLTFSLNFYWKICFKFCILEQIIGTVLFICISSINNKRSLLRFQSTTAPTNRGCLPVMRRPFFRPW